MENLSRLTVKKASELAGVSRPTLYKYINNGEISVVKDGKSTFIDPSELLRVFPDARLLSSNHVTVNNLHDLTTELTHKDELINLLKQQLIDKQKDNEFLKEQLTQVNTNFTQLNKLLENKTSSENPKTQRKFLGLFKQRKSYE
jgi:excisionase family DNA binding protein